MIRKVIGLLLLSLLCCTCSIDNTIHRTTFTIGNKAGIPLKFEIIGDEYIQQCDTIDVTSLNIDEQKEVIFTWIPGKYNTFPDGGVIEVELKFVLYINDIEEMRNLFLLKKSEKFTKHYIGLYHSIIKSRYSDKEFQTRILNYITDQNDIDIITNCYYHDSNSYSVKDIYIGFSQQSGLSNRDEFNEICENILEKYSIPSDDEYGAYCDNYFIGSNRKLY